MSARDLRGSSEYVSALHTIAGLPLDRRFPLFQHYPGMKLGVRECVRFYADLLVPLAAGIIAGQADDTEWVVTAPPFYAIPAGANLMAAEVFRALDERFPSRSLRAVDLRYSCPNPKSTQDGVSGHDYSRSGVADRERNRQKLHEGKWAPKPDPADFRDRAVLFINDINVTGTQQLYVQRTLESVHPARIHWLYVIQVEPTLGRSNPEIEYELNHLKLGTFEDFGEILVRADIDYTSRCVERLLRYPVERLKPLLRSLDPARRKELQELIAREGAYTGVDDMTKVALLHEP